MSTLAERIAACMQRNPHLKKREIARACKIASPSVSDWVNGKTKTLKANTALLASQLFGCDQNWLSDGIGEPNWRSADTTFEGAPVAALPDDVAPGPEYVQIRECKVRFAAGNGRQALFDEEHDSLPATYRRDWFVRHGINPERARRFAVKGDSMSPMLHDGDRVLVNLAETEIVNGHVYALRYGDELRIKRVYRQLDDSLILHSDNPDHVPRDEQVPPAIVADQIAIIGRVRDKSGSGGL